MFADGLVYRWPIASELLGEQRVKRFCGELTLPYTPWSPTLKNPKLGSEEPEFKKEIIEDMKKKIRKIKTKEPRTRRRRSE